MLQPLREPAGTPDFKHQASKVLLNIQLERVSKNLNLSGKQADRDGSRHRHWQAAAHECHRDTWLYRPPTKSHWGKVNLKSKAKRHWYWQAAAQTCHQDSPLIARIRCNFCINPTTLANKKFLFLILSTLHSSLLHRFQT